MTSLFKTTPIGDSFVILDGLGEVLSSPLFELAGAFSELLRSRVQHSALVIFTEDCTGRPKKTAGAPAIIDKITIGELDAIRNEVLNGGEALWNVQRIVGGAEHLMAAWPSSTGAILVLIDPVLLETELASFVRTLIGSVFQIVAVNIRQQVVAAPANYLQSSRAASAERSRVLTELSESHAATLEALLAILRSRHMEDAVARKSAADLAASAMVTLRALTDRDRSLSEEPVATAFERLRDDLRPLVRFSDIDVQFVEPPADGRALPGEVAHAGRAIVRGAVLALIEQANVRRVRLQWDCDGRNLLIGIRDDGPGDLTPNVPSVRQLADRVSALEGTLRVEGTEGWGSEIAVTLPLDAPTLLGSNGEEEGWGLSEREREVLELVALGGRNRSIAEKLTISENTVKFHVSNLLRKMGATTRAELAALVR